MLYKYDGENDQFVPTDAKIDLWLTSQEKKHIATLKQKRKYVVVIVYKTRQHIILTEPDNPHFFAETVEDLLSYICEMYGDLEGSTARVM